MVNKNGKGGGMFLLGIIAVASIALVGIMGWFATQQSAVSEPTAVAEATAETVSALNLGKAATLRIKAYDAEANGKTQVASNVTIEQWDGAKVGEGSYSLISNDLALSASDATSVSTSVGKNLKVCSYALANYYGTCQEVKVMDETQSVDLDVNAMIIGGRTSSPQNVKMDCFDNGADNTVESPSGIFANNCSITLGSQQVASFDYLRVELNASNRAWNFKGIAINTSGTSNLDSVTIEGSLGFENIVASGSLAEQGTVPKRLKTGGNNVKWYWEAPQAIMLHQYDVLKTPSIVLDASDSTDPAETFQLIFVDESQFRSVKSETLNRILSGVETDAPSAVDVGATDQLITVVVA